MKTIIIVQCRLSSTRLPQKALYKLDDGVLLDWALKSMRMVKADDYFVACDYDSEAELTPVVIKNKFKIFAGSKDDVLDRFCKLIERENPDVVLRATADNPFLFYDAAGELLELYKKEYFDSVDYITYSGLPHGSGIEIFKAASLLKARAQTSLSYDHEHVGPALYNHPDRFNSLFLTAPEKYNHPQLRTTIDTYADYLRACDVINCLKSDNICAPYTSEAVVKALQDFAIAKKILFIPSVKKGQGTGHLRRCAELAEKVKGAIYIDELTSNKIEYEEFLKNLAPSRVIKKLPLCNEYDLIVCDMFKMTEQEALRYSKLGKTVFIDEGSDFTELADYVLDIIPSGLKRIPNLSNPRFIPAPENVNKEYACDKDIKKILICFGGEDPAGLTEKIIPALIDFDCLLTVISNDENKIKSFIPEPVRSKVKVLTGIENLKEHLYEYDLVITHYGFTAFECVYSNTPVLLAATSKLHQKLSDMYGFTCISKNEITSSNLKKILKNKSLFKPSFTFNEEISSELKDFVLNLSNASSYDCPVCKNGRKGSLVERTAHHTFRKCPDCNMTFISFSDDSESVKYEKSYFAEEYKKQYGKTYLEDFEAIKKNCVGRIKHIDKILRQENGSKKNILDIGCAYGPFLSAASDDNWTPFGSDIAVDAISYVKNTLGFKATNASFAELNLEKEFGVKELDAVTMWYVIEHIKDLKTTLLSINKMLKKNGIFAFSTPNGAGLSRKINQHAFFTNSPKDHYSVWELPETQKYLKKFGFKVCRMVPQGIHPERIPFIKKHNIGQDKLLFKLLKFLMKALKIGDTYEVYCKKINGIKNEL